MLFLFFPFTPHSDLLFFFFLVKRSYSDYRLSLSLKSERCVPNLGFDFRFNDARREHAPKGVGNPTQRPYHYRHGGKSITNTSHQTLC